MEAAVFEISSICSLIDEVSDLPACRVITNPRVPFTTSRKAIAAISNPFLRMNLFI